MDASAVTVGLPGGSWLGGRRTLTAEVRVPTAADESLLHDAGRALPPAERLTMLLAALVVRLPGVENVDADAVRALTVGDREAIALELRRATFGDRLDCALACPVCAQPLDVPAAVSQLLHGSYDRSAEWHEAVLPARGGDVRVRFRLPVGADQEAVAPEAATDPAAAALALFERCVAEAQRVPGGELVSPLPGEARERLSELMAELDPQADTVLALECPACDAAIEAPFDAGSYLLDELAAASDDLLQEVHALASRYHWSERDIVELPLPRRRRYLELLADGAPEP